MTRLSNCGFASRLFADKRFVATNLNFVNMPNLSRVLRSKVFVSENKQLRVVNQILDFKPLSNKFPDVGNAIRVGDTRLAQIDISMPGFLTRKGTVQVELPSHRSPHGEAVPREEIASSCLSLGEEIDQFWFEEEREEQGEPVIEVSDSEDELDKSSGVRSIRFIVARITRSLEEEEEEMPLERKKGSSFRELLAGRSKRSTSKDTSGSQLPPPPPSASPCMVANLRKRKNDKEVVK